MQVPRQAHPLVSTFVQDSIGKLLRKTFTASELVSKSANCLPSDQHLSRNKDRYEECGYGPRPDVSEETR